MPFMLVLVLRRFAGTRTRWQSFQGEVEQDYEYHFVEYEYEQE